MNRKALLNAFSPAQEVLDPELFAGRHDQLKSLSDALRTVGSCPVIYGDRGLGKSSLAVQCQLIAMGNGELLEEADAADWILSDEETYLTFFVTCSDDVRTFDDLQKRILNAFHDFSDEGVKGGAGNQLIDKQTRRKISLKVFETETTTKYEKEAKRLNVENLNLTEKIRREAELLADCYSQQILVIIDELDRVENVTGLASFLKAMSSERLKFVLVGIAQSLSDLDLDHPSIERHLWPVQVPRMSRKELREIVSRALRKLASEGIEFTFSSGAASKLVECSAGFPWFVHVIGQSALLEASNAEVKEVNESHLNDAIRNLTKNRFAQHFRDSYQQAVRDSYNREVVLRVFAKWRGTDIPTVNVYSAAKKLGVTNPAVYKGHLCSETYGSPLMTPGFQERGLVRFRNEMFKQYVNLTRSLYEGVITKVDEAAKDW